MSLRFSIFPRNGRFFDLFDALADLLVQSSEAMSDLMNHFQNVDMKSVRIRELEDQADNVTHDLYTLVNKTFVTPLDREDIVALAQRMDDVVDHIEATVTSIEMYGIPCPTEAACGLADIARLQCLQLAQAIDVLRHKTRLKEILVHAREINRLENQGDSLFLRANSELFKGEMSVTDIIKWREIYGELENSLDSCENVAHILEAIVLKHG